MPGPNDSTAGEHSPENEPAGGSENQHRPDSRGGFLCGVVEGFYGRPWTTEQRKDLFSKMQVCCESWRLVELRVGLGLASGSF